MSDSTIGALLLATTAALAAATAYSFRAWWTAPHPGAMSRSEFILAVHAHVRTFTVTRMLLVSAVVWLVVLGVALL